MRSGCTVYAVTCSYGKLTQRIGTFVTRYNRTASPFAWTATDSILAKLKRLAKATNGASR